MSVNLFDANFYRAANSDLASLNDAQALSHFQTFGLNEGRAFSPFANLNFYRSSNADLASFNNQQTYEHLQNYGVAEGRRFSAFVDLNFYKAGNADLAGFNNEQLFEHLRNNGVGEGRQFSVAFDVNYYRNGNSDLASANLNNRQLLEHFEIYGLGEGRASSVVFDVSYYLANNSDLKAAGFNNFQAYDHFVLYGLQERRSASSELADNTSLAAREIVVDSTTNTFSITGFVGNTDSTDFYKLTLGSTSALNLSLTGLSADANLVLIRDANNNGSVEPSEVLASSALTQTSPESITLRSLAAGTYFVNVVQLSNTNYSLKLSTNTPSNLIAEEVNLGSYATGARAVSSVIASGAVNDNNTSDIYSFSVKQNGSLRFNLRDLSPDAEFRLFRDANNNGIFDYAQGELVANSTSDGKGSRSIDGNFSAGITYFLQVSQSGTNSTNYRLWL